MGRGWYTRLAVLLGLTLLSAYLLYPSYYFYFRATEAQRDDNAAFCRALPAWAHCAKLNLGLDLQGGVHLVMGVRVDKALEHRADRLADAARDVLADKKLSVARIDRPHPGTEILVALNDGQAPEPVERALRRELPAVDVARRGTGTLALTLTAAEADAVRDGALEQSIKTIRNRADRLGVTEPTIARRGVDQVLIQLPGVKDPDHAIELIGRTAQLEFHMVDREGDKLLAAVPASALPRGVRAARSGPGGGVGALELPEAAADAVAEAIAPHLPDGRTVAFGPAMTAGGQERAGRLRAYVIEARPGITGDYLTNAQVQQDRDVPSDYYVTMTFDPAGAKIFERLTEEHTGQAMAIVLDGKITSAPVIQEKIAGGTARITLGRGGDPQRKFQEAKDLTLVLKAGALPAPVEVREKRQVGKTLGQDTVARGTFAMAVGAGLVVVFMALYYKKSGLMANVALALNVLFMLAVLAFIEATLTLPGMAGIVLTIGMAVDANVLIFERIREELRAGRPARAAIDAGYKKAFGTIFDSNLTTLIAGVVLMQYGSGPVRGFAVTLIIGLTCSLYTAIVVTRLIYDFTARSPRLTALSI